MTDKIDTFKTGNTVWSVTVRAKRFVAEAHGFNAVSGATWDEMERNARTAAAKAKVKVAVPYRLVEWSHTGARSRATFRRRTATGINAGSGNVTYTTEGSGSGQETYSNLYLQPMSDEDERLYLELTETIRSLTAERDELARKYKFDGGLKAAVQRAIDEEHARRGAGQS